MTVVYALRPSLKISKVGPYNLIKYFKKYP